MGRASIQEGTLAAVMDRYGWNPTNVKNIGNVWKVTCGDGVYALKCTKASKEKLIVLQRILDKVSSGFPHILPWIKSEDGSTVVVQGETRWYATAWKDSEGGHKISSEDVIQALAVFHRAAESAIRAYPELRTNFTDQNVTQWKKNSEAVAGYTEKRESREFQSPFDKRFSHSEEMIGRVVDFSIRGMERFLELEKGKLPRFTLCHKKCRQSHIVQDPENFYFINFDHAQVESPIRDIANSLRKMCDPINEDHPLELLAAYEAKNKLLPIEKKLLALHLAYPEKLLKIAGEYYGGEKRAKNELVSLRSLEKEISMLEQFEDLIKVLWNSKKSKDTVGAASSPIKVASRKKGNRVKV